MNKEIRTVEVPVEVRAADDGSVKVEGYAAVFDEETNIGDVFREVIRKGAFRNALERKDDVAFLINHGGLPLARTRSGTLELEEDERGLKVRSTLDGSDPDVARIVPKMRRGDLDKMSFAFSVPKGGQNWAGTDADGLDLREITDTVLYDVSIVTEPAYGGTDIALRSRICGSQGRAGTEVPQNLRFPATAGGPLVLPTSNVSPPFRRVFCGV